jgi:hypothetical protein
MVAAQMDDWLKQAKAANFGAAAQPSFGAGGVNYISSTAGSQTYNASALVSR